MSGKNVPISPFESDSEKIKNISSISTNLSNLNETIYNDCESTLKIQTKIKKKGKDFSKARGFNNDNWYAFIDTLPEKE